MSDKKEYPVYPRADYMDGKVSHQDYYMGIAGLLGVRGLMMSVAQIASDAELVAAIRDDAHLNGIALHKWDNMHNSVLYQVSGCSKNRDQLAIALGCKREAVGWSLSDTVCVLKAVAREKIATTLDNLKVESGVTADLAKSAAVFTKESMP